jgi:hypothetical protein
MSVWLTYSLSDILLFSPQTYYRLFELYNRAVWPGQLVALGAGAAILLLLRRPGGLSGRAIAGLLAALWLWVAWAFHLERYATINWAASWPAAGFALQALLLAWTGVVRGRLRFRPGRHPVGRAGLGLFVFALVVQPWIGLVGPRSWASVEIFGLAPDPTAVATLGLLLAADGPVRWVLLPLPVLWCLVSGATLWAMAAPDAPVAPLAAVLTLLLAGGRAIAAMRRRAPARAR